MKVKMFTALRQYRMFDHEYGERALSIWPLALNSFTSRPEAGRAMLDIKRPRHGPMSVPPRLWMQYGEAWGS